MKIYDTIHEINLDYIEPDLNQPRKTFRRDTLVELAESIKTSGLINPILVEKMNGKEYKIVVGHRRFEACRIANIKKIRCQVVEDLTPEQRLEIQIIEDSQEPIPLWESARGIVKLYEKLEQRRIRRGDKKAYSLKLYSARIGKGELTIRRAFRYMNLAPSLKKLVRNEKIKYEIATEIGRIEDYERQEREAMRITKERYNLKQTKEYVDNVINPPDYDGFFLQPEVMKETRDRRLRMKMYDYLNPAIRTLKTIFEISLFEPKIRKLIKKREVKEKFKEFKETFSSIEDAINQESKYLQTLEYKPPKELSLKERIFIGKQKRIREAGEIIVSRHNYSNDVKWISVKEIEEDPGNVRRTFKRESLEELADSIKNVGIIHPILIEKVNGKYKIVVGHRRARGAELAGMKKLRCLEISTLTDDERLELQIAEDSQEPFSLDERAEAWKRLFKAEQEKAKKKDKGKEYTMKDFCKKLGKSPSTVRKAFAFLRLDDRVKTLVREQVIRYGIGVELSYVDNSELQYWTALRAAMANYTVTKTRAAIKFEEEDKLYSMPEKWKREIERFSKENTLKTIVRQLTDLLETKNQVISMHFNIKGDDDGKIRKRVFGWRRIIRKFYDMRKSARKIEEEFY